MLAVLDAELVFTLTTVEFDTSGVGVTVSTARLSVPVFEVTTEVNVALLSTVNGSPHDEVDACGVEILRTAVRVVPGADSDTSTVNGWPHVEVVACGIKAEGSATSVEVAGRLDASTVKGSPQVLVCAETMPTRERSIAFWSDDIIFLVVGMLGLDWNGDYGTFSLPVFQVTW